MRWGCRYSDIALEISGKQFAEYRICISLQINRLCSGSDFRVAPDFYCVSGSQTRKGKIRHLGQYRIILSAETASEVRQLLSQKRR